MFLTQRDADIMKHDALMQAELFYHEFLRLFSGDRAAPLLPNPPTQPTPDQSQPPPEVPQ